MGQNVIRFDHDCFNIIYILVILYQTNIGTNILDHIINSIDDLKYSSRFSHYSR